MRRFLEAVNRPSFRATFLNFGLRRAQVMAELVVSMFLNVKAWEEDILLRQNIRVFRDSFRYFDLVEWARTIPRESKAGKS
jgi:hypothetical protein